MPNIKSAKKRVKTTEIKTLRNKSIKSDMKTAIKKVDAAIALVYYYKKSPQAGLRGSLIALGVSMVLVAAVLYGVVPGIVKVGGWFELFFVNTLGLPFNTGMVVYLLVLIGVVLTAIWSTTKKDRKRSVVLYTLSIMNA